METKLTLREHSRKATAQNFRTDTALLQGGAPRGQSAYEQAVEGGYTGTKAEFEEALATGITTISENITDLNTVADNITDINTVADNIADVHTVAENISDVNTVADNVSDVNTVAGISSDVTQVSGISNAVQTVSSHDSEVTLVADNMASVMTTASHVGDIQTVAGVASDVSTVAGISSNVTSVAGNTTNINKVANNESNINTVAGNTSDINTVVTNLTDIQTVANNATGISSVAGDLTNIDTVASNLTDIGTVATNISDVSSVAGDLSNIDTAVSNLAAINAAPTAASNAATSATNAQTWAEGTDVQVAALGGTKSSKGWAARAEEIITSIGTVMRYKGSVADYAALQAIQNPTLGDTYNVLDTGSNYTWDGTDWDAISSTVDLSAYRTSAAQDVIDATKQATLVSGTNIKTVNNTSLLGSGDITIDSLPSQTGQSGKFLTTDGTSASWAATPTEIPSQSGQSGKFLTTDGTDLSWANAGSGSLPSQAGNSGKFLTTDGTDASWGDALKNTATGTNALTILGFAAANKESVNIGKSSSSSTQRNVAVGTYAMCKGNNVSSDGVAPGASATAIGYYAEAETGTALGSCTEATKGVAIGRGQLNTNKVIANKEGSIAIGVAYGSGTDKYVKATATDAIQLGKGVNNVAKQFQVYTYPMLDGTTGLIPAARIPDLSGTYLPTTSAGVANGVASLDANGKVPTSQLPYKAGNGIKISEKQFSDFYTTVGSPTNNNGVISDLNESNYVHLTNKIQSISDLRTLKVHTVFMASALSNASVVFAIGAYNMKFNVRSDNKFYFQYRPLSAPNTLQTDSSSAVTIPLNSEIEVDLFYTKDTSATLVVQSGGNVLWNHSTSDITITGNDDFMFGTDHAYFGGQYLSIDLNKTNVQVNGEYIVYDINSTYIDEEGYTLIDTYSNGSSWYKVFAEKQADGTIKKWCEQGGHFAEIASATPRTVNLLKAYTDTNYNIQVSFSTTGNAFTNAAGASYCTACNKTASSFDLYTYTDTRLADKDWRACGYID